MPLLGCKFGSAGQLSLLIVALLLCSTLATSSFLQKRKTKKGTFVYGAEHEGKAKLQPLYGQTWSDTSKVPLPPNIDINDERKLTLAQDTILTHGTDVLFKVFNAKPTWFSHDPTEGIKMAIMGNLNKVRANNPDKPATDLYVRSVKVKRNLKLYVMAATEKASLDHLVAAYRFPKQGKFVLGSKASDTTELAVAAQALADWTWYGRPTDSSAAFEFTKKFCAFMGEYVNSPNTVAELIGTRLVSRNFDGWRNPYDQDEIMLCMPTPANKPVIAEIQARYRKCPAATLTNLVGFPPKVVDDLDEQPPGLMAEECGILPANLMKLMVEGADAPLRRLHYFIVPRARYCAGYPLFRDIRDKHPTAATQAPLKTVNEWAAADVSHALYHTLCPTEHDHA